jgi:hypothetical protein
LFDFGPAPFEDVEIVLVFAMPVTLTDTKLMVGFWWVLYGHEFACRIPASHFPDASKD